MLSGSQCVDYRNSFSLFLQKFRETNVLPKKLLKSWFDEILFWWELIFHFTTAVWMKPFTKKGFITKVALKFRFFFSRENVTLYVEQTFWWRFLRENVECQDLMWKTELWNALSQRLHLKDFFSVNASDVFSKQIST